MINKSLSSRETKRKEEEDKSKRRKKKGGKEENKKESGPVMWIASIRKTKAVELSQVSTGDVENGGGWEEAFYRRLCHLGSFVICGKNVSKETR